MKKASKKGSRGVDLDTTLRVARNARLRLSLDEAKRFQKELNEILAAFDNLRKIKTNASPSFHPLDVKNVMRKDELEKCLPHDVALSNTAHKENGFFKGPRSV